MLEGKEEHGEHSGIEFGSGKQEMCFQRIGSFIKGHYGADAVLSDQEPQVTIHSGSASTRLYVGVLWEDEAIVLISSTVLRGTKLSTDLLETLLRENERMGGLAGFSINAKDEIVLTASLMGDCSEKQLTLSIAQVANTADKFDDLIKKKWGGSRASE
ncbi:MAG: hypothetical protein ABI670_09080 [Chloroflexota bacterium]